MDAVTSYEQARMALDLVEAQKAETKRQVMAVIQPQLDEIDAEYQANIDHLSEQLKVAETELRAAVLIQRETIKGQHVTASFTNGREKVNADAVKGFMRAHGFDPNVFIETGEPSVTIRWVR